MSRTGREPPYHTSEFRTALTGLCLRSSEPKLDAQCLGRGEPPYHTDGTGYKIKSLGKARVATRKLEKDEKMNYFVQKLNRITVAAFTKQ